MSANELRVHHRGRAVLVVLGGIVLAVGVGVAIGKAANYTKLLHSLREAETAWLGLCLAGEVLAYVGYVLAYRAVAAVDGGPLLSVSAALRVVAATFGALVVATGAGALAVSFWALRRAGATRDEAFARVLGLNTLEWGVLGTAATAAGAAMLVGVPPGAPLSVILPWLVIVPACIAAAVWVSAPCRRDRLSRVGGGTIRGLFGAAVRGVVLVRMLVARPGAGLFGTVIYWTGDLLCLWAGLRAFGVHLPVAGLALAYATGYVSSALPLPAGGAGGVDAAMTYALTLVGVPLAPALLATFTYRFFNFWLPLIPAVILLPSVRGLARELPQSPRAPSFASTL
jgi:uncharacterized membrane protein YbhN (UPF0104 family)